MDTIQYIALSMGVAWASGINLYAAILTLGYLGSNGNIDLPPEMIVVTDPLVMSAAGLMYCIEFFADKTPGVDTAWDSLHTFIRIPLGAVLAMSAVGEVTPALELAAFLVGGGLTAATHATKAGSRVIINSSPEPVSNWFTSLGEDFLVIIGMWTALTHPLFFIVLLILFIILIIWLLPKIWRGIKRVFSTLRDFIKGNRSMSKLDSSAE
ncbi:MAG: hypothetical protein CMF45_00515 [Legionellales bacterium]|nr:hypothetical protein [Legionellales bacterium]